jgi:uncharacterized protein (DUF39 family)
MINVVEVTLGPAFIGVFTLLHSEPFLIFHRIYLLLKVDNAVSDDRLQHVTHTVSSRHWKPVRNDTGTGHLLLLVVSGRQQAHKASGQCRILAPRPS